MRIKTAIHAIILGLLMMSVLPVLAQDTGADEYWLRWSPDSKQLAFTSNRAGQTDLYVVNVSGGEPRLVKENLAFEFEWSPDGQTITYVENGAIYLLNAADGSSKSLIEGEAVYGLIGWSPDGAWLLYSEAQGEQYIFYIMNQASGGTQQISDKPMDALYPTWSPDSRHIAFTILNAESGMEEVYVYNLESDTLSNNLLRGYWDRNKECCALFDWSPDSTHLLVHKRFDGTLYMIDIATEQIIPVVYTGGPIYLAYWLPQGGVIYLLDWEDPDTRIELPTGADAGVYRVAPDAKVPQLVTDGIGTWLYLSPDGKHALLQNIAVTTYRGKNQPRALELIDLNTFNLIEIETLDTNSNIIEWSPDSTQVAAALCIDGDYDIILIDGVSGDFVNLTQDDAFTGEQVSTQCNFLG